MLGTPPPADADADPAPGFVRIITIHYGVRILGDHNARHFLCHGPEKSINTSQSADGRP